MQAADIKQIDVRVEKSYTIFIADDIKELLEEHVSGKRVFIVTDSNVFNLYSVFLKELTSDIFIMKAGEGSKNYKTLLSIYDFLIGKMADRYSLIVAIGGGVVGDIGGFAASTYMRGMPLVHVPTSLLAMVDSSIGGKTAINYANLKNVIGSFYQPKSVFIGVNFLKTLPEREYISAFAEVIKYGIIKDRNLFEFIEKNVVSLRKRNIEVLKTIIERSVKNKVDIVERDEKEKNIRAILNFGHTFAHAIESITRYRVYLHGEAVAIGMIMAAKVSKSMGLIDDYDVKRIISLVESLGLPTRISVKFNKDDMYRFMLTDKKNRDSILRFVLTRGIGDSIISPGVAKEVILNSIDEEG